MPARLRQDWVVGEVGEGLAVMRGSLPWAQIGAWVSGGGESGFGSSEKKGEAAAKSPNSAGSEGEEVKGRCGGEG